MDIREDLHMEHEEIQGGDAEEGRTYRVWVQVECELEDGTFENGEPDMLYESSSINDAEDYAETLVSLRDPVRLYLVMTEEYEDAEPIAIASDARRARKFAYSFGYSIYEMALNDFGPLWRIHHKEIEAGKTMFRVSIGKYGDYANITDEYEPPTKLQSVYKTTVWAYTRKEAIEIAHAEWEQSR
jgi:hypothetical protein